MFHYCCNENYRFSLNLLEKYILKTMPQGKNCKNNMVYTQTNRESPNRGQRFTEKFTRCCMFLPKNELEWQINMKNLCKMKKP